MINGIPSFPQEIGEEGALEFMKDGQQYRIARIDEDTLIIHKRDTPPSAFEIVLSNFSRDGRTFDAEGNGHIGPLMGYGADRAILNRLF